ncbi:MAG: efflux RND transporter periplasmic adaptor subunit [Janthinobacterium lividum]
MRMRLSFSPTAGLTLATARAAALAAALAGGLALSAASARAAASAPASGVQATAAVATVAPRRGIIAQPVLAYGKVTASAASLHAINLPYAARVDQILVPAGQAVRKGAPLLQVTADPAALLATQQAVSALQLAQVDHDRMQALLAQHLATASQLAVSQKALDDARQGLAAQQRNGAAAGTVRVTAPSDGVVTVLSVGQGDRVPAGTTLMQFAANDGAGTQPNVAFSVEPDDAPQVRIGDPVILTGLSSALRHRPVTGRVTQIGAALDPQTHQVPIGVNAALSGAFYLPGTSVQGIIQTRAAVHWIVPRAAVLGMNDGADAAHGGAVPAASTYLFQVDAARTARRIAVTIAVEAGDDYGVDGALDASRPVIVSGNYEVGEGEGVRVAAPAQPGAGAR